MSAALAPTSISSVQLQLKRAEAYSPLPMLKEAAWNLLRTAFHSKKKHNMHNPLHRTSLLQHRPPCKCVSHQSYDITPEAELGRVSQTYTHFYRVESTQLRDLILFTLKASKAPKHLHCCPVVLSTDRKRKCASYRHVTRLRSRLYTRSVPPRCLLQSYFCKAIVQQDTFITISQEVVSS